MPGWMLTPAIPTQEAEAGGSPWVPGQPRRQRDLISQRAREKGLGVFGFFLLFVLRQGLAMVDLACLKRREICLP